MLRRIAVGSALVLAMGCSVRIVPEPWVPDARLTLETCIEVRKKIADVCMLETQKLNAQKKCGFDVSGLQSTFDKYVSDSETACADEVGNLYFNEDVRCFMHATTYSVADACDMRSPYGHSIQQVLLRYVTYINEKCST